MLELPEQLRHMLAMHGNQPLHLVDSATRRTFVLIPADAYRELIEFRNSPTLERRGTPRGDGIAAPEMVQSDLSEDPITKIRAVLNPPGEIRLIPDAPGYAISDQGEIFSFKSKVPCRVKTQVGRTDGYVHFKLLIEGNTKQVGGVVHRLVAKVFVPRAAGEGEIVRHIDGNRANNAASNLCWGTVRENMADRDAHGTTPWTGSRHPDAKLSEPDILEIRKLLRDLSVEEIAKKYSVSRGTITNIRDGKSWRRVQ
jgi:hypothetical protein